MITLYASPDLLDKSDAELRTALRFHKRFPESATETRMFVISMILEARLHRARGLVRHAERYEAQVFEVLFFTNDEIHHACNGEPMYSEAAL